MTKLTWKPWHQAVQLRPDLLSGDLPMAQFAADLYDVVMDRGTSVYRTPYEFFALTYPTYNLRELAKDVVRRLAGKSDKAVRQLELTYGGGKTHTLITLLHLVRDPASLPDLPAVQEFRQHIGMTPPRTRVVTMPFDKFDVEKGMEVLSPDGKKRWLRNPWSVLAYQVAGSEGLRLLHADGEDAERETAPAENLLGELLAIPAREDLATLILIDEVLMYARGKVGHDAVWRERLVDFFQYLTQAATKEKTCAIVASLLATEPKYHDTLGKAIALELSTILRREREEGIQPVVKEDVAEVLRRRFFLPDSIRDIQAFRPHVVAALQGISALDDATRKEGNAAEQRYLANYPFHPDLTDVLYTKWTQLEGFQRTRGVLRTFALALRDAAKWDQSPLVGPNVFLTEPGKPGVSAAARELTDVASKEEYEGKRQEWDKILEGELAKARSIQEEVSGLNHREIEQAVFATFLHSQPVGHRASLRDVTLLVSPSRPDKIQLEKALLRWADLSHFLDDQFTSEANPKPDGRREIPRSWRLGSKPNLKQMHSDACARIQPELVEAKLLKTIEGIKNLTAGTSGDGYKVKVHMLPDKPSDVGDEGEFHFAVLGPKAASSSGNPSAEARRYLDETTAADRPRVHRNAVVLAVPSRDGLEVARTRIRDYLAWEEVQSQLKEQKVDDPIRVETLVLSLETAKKEMPKAVQQAYNIVVTVAEDNEVQAFKLTVDTSRPLFEQIKADQRSRIQETAISYEALMPEGPYDLWRSGETARRVKDLVGAFAQFPHLPKMLNRQAILDTLIQGCVEGQFVLRLTRPDRSTRTIWRRAPDEADLKNTTMEVVLPEAAELSQIEPALLAPRVLPSLWTGPDIAVADVRAYFSGRVIQVARQSYDEPVTIPKAPRSVVDEAITWAVKEGKLWLTDGPTSLHVEDVPSGLLGDKARLQPPPSPISASDVLPANLADAWAGDVTTAHAISEALSAKVARPLPWATVRSAIDAALQGRLLERTVDSGPWPCDYAGTREVRVRVPESPPPPDVLVASTYLKPAQVQDLADVIGDVGNAAVGHNLKILVRIEVGAVGNRPPEAIVAKINSKLGGVSKDFKIV
jgi:hypothetical protein